MRPTMLIGCLEGEPAFCGCDVRGSFLGRVVAGDRGAVSEAVVSGREADSLCRCGNAWIG